MKANKFDKDPGAVLDYQVDWNLWLNGDTILTSTWTVDTGITANSDTHTTTTATIWLSGGTPGQTYVCVNHITTAGGRTDDRQIVVFITNK